jgi:hypothetical protein
LALTFAFAGSAQAFCRSKACDDTQMTCPRDPHTDCVVPGSPLNWASGCVDIYVQQDGAPSEGIDADTTMLSLQRAFDAWLGTDCDGAPPSLQVNVMGTIECGTAEYNSKGRNANIVTFREQDWPYPGSQDALALTHPMFQLDGNGAIYDSDIEINAFGYDFDPTGADPSKADLDSVLTHEVGHWLGLDHATDSEATMFSPFPGGTEFRTLAPDDRRGICEIYPPGRAITTASCEPRHGFSERCFAEQTPEERRVGDSSKEGGCSIGARSPQPQLPGALLGAICAALGGSWLRRSRRARGPRPARTVA